MMIDARAAVSVCAIWVCCFLTVAGPQVAQGRTVIDLGLGKAEDINNVGQVVGDNASVGRGFLWQSGVRTDIGTLGGSWCVAFDINDQGQIVGESRKPGHWVQNPILPWDQYYVDGDLHGFLWENGVMTDLGTLYGSTSRAFGINNLGQVVGRSDVSGGGQHAFLWQDGTITDLGLLPGHFKSEGRYINDAGKIVGYSEAHDTDFHPVIWEGGTITDIGSFGGVTSAEALALNENELGQVVGFAPDASEQPRAFLWENGSKTDLGTLAGASSAMAYDINESGLIVGESGGRAVLWQNGSIIDLNTYIDPASGWVLTNAFGVNDQGWICGMGTFGGAAHAYVLVPEPATLSLLGMAALVLIRRPRRRGGRCRLANHT